MTKWSCFFSILCQTSVSESTLVALLAARNGKIRQLKAELQEDVEDSVLNAKLVAYCSDQVRIITITSNCSLIFVKLNQIFIFDFTDAFFIWESRSDLSGQDQISAHRWAFLPARKYSETSHRGGQEEGSCSFPGKCFTQQHRWLFIRKICLNIFACLLSKVFPAVIKVMSWHWKLCCFQGNMSLKITLNYLDSFWHILNRLLIIRLFSGLPNFGNNRGVCIWQPVWTGTSLYVLTFISETIHFSPVPLNKWNEVKYITQAQKTNCGSTLMLHMPGRRICVQSCAGPCRVSNMPIHWSSTRPSGWWSILTV